MARDATPRLRAQALPELQGGVELLIVESVLAHPDPNTADGYEEEHSLCVLALVAPTETERRWLRIEAQRYVGARASVVPVVGSEWAAGVAEALIAHGKALVDVVVGLPDHGAAAIEKQVLALTNRLQAAPSQLCTTVAVAGEPAKWVGLTGRWGLLSAQGCSAAQGAILLHAGLAQLSAAPGLVECFTSANLEPLWGTPDRPGHLVAMDCGQLSQWATRRGPESAGTSQIAVFCLANDGLARHRAITSDLKAAGLEDHLIAVSSGLTVGQLDDAEGRLCVVVTGAVTPASL